MDPQTSDPSFCADQKVRVFPTIRDGDKSSLGQYMLQTQRSSDVLAVHDNFAKHGHDGGGWTIRRCCPSLKPLDKFARMKSTEAFGTPIGKDIKFEASRDHLSVEIQGSLFS
jgi:hypothetical protein